MNIETICQDLSLLIKNYVQDIQSLRNRYKHLDPNYMHFYCAKITNKNVSARMEENKSGNKENGHNNCERNSSKNNNRKINARKYNKSTEKT